MTLGRDGDDAEDRNDGLTTLRHCQVVKAAQILMRVVVLTVVFLSVAPDTPTLGRA